MHGATGHRHALLTIASLTVASLTVVPLTVTRRNNAGHRRTLHRAARGIPGISSALLLREIDTRRHREDALSVAVALPRGHAAAKFAEALGHPLDAVPSA